MKQPISHPTVEAVEEIHTEVLEQHGGAAGLRDRTLLESAIAAPRAAKMGKPLLTDPIEIAAAYLFHLRQNHPFIDGNKRVALATALVFLSENNLLPHETLDIAAWEKLTLDVAAGQLDRSETAQRLRQIL